MTFAVQTDCMPTIAYIDSQTQMRRSLVGALATDPVVPEAPAPTKRRPLYTWPTAAGGATKLDSRSGAYTSQNHPGLQRPG
jgi:hypothetical protein